MRARPQAGTLIRIPRMFYAFLARPYTGGRIYRSGYLAEMTADQAGLFNRPRKFLNQPRR
ncbi:hypothetical protein CENSYa_0830 [Cenarchaeum symbiosum A]|uniref:Uncharacterized protein n=1 Tax=Cenarchaeum symbiosum (strain A) TaxID=414004 RepID=A0RVU6_CENSY|nr:hypothetical protein CENSYa_0830 [Cenarchaeum symbiosum A]